MKNTEMCVQPIHPSLFASIVYRIFINYITVVVFVVFIFGGVDGAPVFPRGGMHQLAEYTGKVLPVVESDDKPDFHNGKLGAR
ncbi:hypothetical protein SDC9_210586 [bioreactor metagenome]|uniref:Transmembrane protein n=1 Tax=bioreactor metagenome TaxID=1076179 RepID=A0A645JU93_9ZZZZ